MRHAFRKHAVLAAAAALFCWGAVAADESSVETRIHDLCVQKLGKDAEPIRVTVKDDHAILEGKVASRSVQRLAREVALSVPGIQTADDRIALERTLPAAGKTGDFALRTAARDRLVSDVGGEASRALVVEAVDGWVSVRGKLPDAMRRDQAIHALQGLDGVTHVVDLITIAP